MMLPIYIVDEWLRRDGRLGFVFTYTNLLLTFTYLRYLSVIDVIYDLSLIEGFIITNAAAKYASTLSTFNSCLLYTSRCV